jgi:hypothetical protein
MKEPRLLLQIEVTYNEYLGLLWSLEGMLGAHPDKQTIHKIKRFHKEFRKRYREWREADKRARKKLDSQAPTHS